MFCTEKNLHRTSNCVQSLRDLRTELAHTGNYSHTRHRRSLYVCISKAFSNLISATMSFFILEKSEPNLKNVRWASHLNNSVT